MNKNIHQWNVILVTKFKFPYRHDEFKVESKNILGATMKASKILKEKNKADEENLWRILSVYWLDLSADKRYQK